MSGFRRAGVYPLNPDAVAITEQPDQSHSEYSPSTQPNSPEVSTESGEHLDVPMTYSPESAPSAGSSLVSTVHLSATCTAAGPSFTEEHIRHYETRYEEGFDIAEDQDYINWLRLNHPDSLKGSKNQVETGEVGLCDASIVSTSEIFLHLNRFPLAILLIVKLLFLRAVRALLQRLVLQSPPSRAVRALL